MVKTFYRAKPLSIMQVKIVDTTLRDAHQSLIATRLKIEDITPILEKIDSVGYYSLEMWGGATYDACLRYLNENPWERLRAIRKIAKKTKLQMLLRGQNIVGYRHYSDDLLEKFIANAIKNGLDIIRIFDALNDIRNLKKAIEFTKKYRAHAQGTISYTISPVHTIENYVKFAKKLSEEKVDSICIKDMAGMLSPTVAYDLVKALKKEISLPIDVHSHYTSGMATASYLKSIEAGAEIVDCAISSLSMQSSQPPTETIVTILKETKYDTKLNLQLLSEISEYFANVRKKYKQFESEIVVDTNVLTYQIPGGMISNLTSQLKDTNAIDKLPLVLKEVALVRKELGYPPLVTPTSQIVGTQAVFNVLRGRYEVILKEVKDYVKGYYGKCPAEIDETIREKILQGEKVIECRAAELIESDYKKAFAEKGNELNGEDLISYALFPQVASKYFESKKGDDKELALAIAVAFSKKKKEVKKIEFKVGREEQNLWKLIGRQGMMRCD